jgi:NTE family protein
LTMHRRLGLALGGGGARGLAHLGVMMALEEAGLVVSCVAGTSMGAAMGAARAVGAKLSLVAEVLARLNVNDLLRVSDSTGRELQKMVRRSMVEYVRGSTWQDEQAPPHDLARLRELFRLLTAGKSFDETEIPFAAVATDLKTGEVVVLRDGRLCDAVVASTAVPGVFSPVVHQGRTLVDGGVACKLPAEIVADMGAQVIVAVDTGASLDREIPTCLDAVLQAQRITSHHLTSLQLRSAAARVEDALVLLQPDVSGIRMFGFEHSKRAIQAGRDAVLSRLESIRRLVSAPPQGETSRGSRARTRD